jgi:purine catabolism regulator
MPPTLASLVHHSALKLTVRAGEDRLDVPVRWAHVSELADPVPYMEGGELLLITALKLDAEDPEAMRRYVHRLAGAGVVGLGFAVGVNYDEIPEALVDAARHEGLPLLEVPRRTPFLAISKAVSAAIAADQYRSVTAGFAAQRELTRQALTDGPEGLLAALASQVDGWAALYDASGAVVAAAPEWAGRRAARLTTDVERLRDRPAPASAVVGGSGSADNDDRVELHSLGTGRRPRAALAVGTASALGTAERYAVHSAIALLTLTTERSRSLQAAEQRIGAAVLRMLLAGEPEHARTVAGDLYGGLLDAPFRLIVAETVAVSSVRIGADAPARVPSAAALAAAAGTNGDPLGALTEIVESAAARSGEIVLAVPEGERLVVLAADGGAAVTACEEYAVVLEAARTREQASAGDEDELVVGVSAPVGPIAAAAAYKQAEQALAVARRRGRVYVEHEQLASGSVLPLLADDAVRAFAGGLLRPLYEHDATGRGDLVAPATLRYRMRRVEEILGRSLDDPDVRMELWLALKAAAAE